jgi:hypothetical protein
MLDMMVKEILKNALLDRLEFENYVVMDTLPCFLCNFDRVFMRKLLGCYLDAYE